MQVEFTYLQILYPQIWLNMGHLKPSKVTGAVLWPHLVALLRPMEVRHFGGPRRALSVFNGKPEVPSKTSLGLSEAHKGSGGLQEPQKNLQRSWKEF